VHDVCCVDVYRAQLTGFPSPGLSIISGNSVLPRCVAILDRKLVAEGRIFMLQKNFIP
ncbi:hypothetical protein STEG23_024915, partial [Scotinomys teguina]